MIIKDRNDGNTDVAMLYHISFCGKYYMSIKDRNDGNTDVVAMFINFWQEHHMIIKNTRRVTLLHSKILVSVPSVANAAV